MDLERCPDDILINIFKHLDLTTRFQAALACRRWHTLLTDSRCRMENVAVLNLFESRIWEQNINGGTKERLKPVMLNNSRRLISLAEHIGQCVSLKLWFDDPQFVVRVLEVLRGRGLRCRCLDLYPYGRQLPLRAVRELYPDLEALIIRPHGSEYFWSGMPFGDCPDFPNLDTLVLESLTLTNDVALPLSVTQMEWSHRDDAAFGGFLDKLERCPSVKYLLIGHVELDEPTCRRLLRIMRVVLRQLLVVVFKFVKFPAIRFDVDDDEVRTNLPNGQHQPLIKVAKFDLCYGDIYHTVSEFVRVFGAQMQIVGINTILEERQLASVYRLMPVLKKRDLWLQLGILQRATGPVVIFNNNPSGANGADNGLAIVDGGRNAEENRNGTSNLLRPPLELCDTVMKLDVSFVDSFPLLNSILTCGIYKNLLELKFIQCKALNDSSLEVVAKFFFRLKRLQLSSCNECTDRGLMHFVRHWDDRRSKQLCIVWRVGGNEASACSIPSLYLRLMLERNVLLEGKKMTRIKKKLPSDGEGERLMVWSKNWTNGKVDEIGDQKSINGKSSEKTLVFQDYCENELHWIMGFSLNVAGEVEEE